MCTNLRSGTSYIDEWKRWFTVWTQRHVDFAGMSVYRRTHAYTVPVRISTHASDTEVRTGGPAYTQTSSYINTYGTVTCVTIATWLHISILSLLHLSDLSRRLLLGQGSSISNHPTCSSVDLLILCNGPGGEFDGCRIPCSVLRLDGCFHSWVSCFFCGWIDGRIKNQVLRYVKICCLNLNVVEVVWCPPHDLFQPLTRLPLHSSCAMLSLWCK